MSSSMTTSLLRVTLFWYVLGVLILFIGSPDWAEEAYSRVQVYPWVPTIEMLGLGTAANVQFNLLTYWTIPVMVLWLVAIAVGFAASEGFRYTQEGLRKVRLVPAGEFWGVKVPSGSLGCLPRPTTPALVGARVELPDAKGDFHDKDAAHVSLNGQMLEAVKALTPAERQLSEELMQLLIAQPEHFAGHGHGVGLLEHTLNVVAEAAERCTPEFRLPLVAALAHDIGKLITFQPDGKGGWRRQGLHSRESARILATLPGFRLLPELHRDALLLAVKYDHAPNKMPMLKSEREPGLLALRVISALSQADRSATAAEKDRNLEKIKPEDLLWQDFVNFLRDAPIVQRGKKGAANQVNNPPDSPYLYIYEAPWRDAAIPRLPAEVAAALDLTRRDAGKVAKYTRILVERLRKEGLLVESHNDLAVTEANPLWDIQSGTGEKAVVLRGILVLKADALWKLLNYRISVKSPFPVQILAPNGDAGGRVNQAPAANREIAGAPEVSDGLKLGAVEDASAMASLGLADAPAGPAAVADGAAPAVGAKPKARGRFKSDAPSPAADDVLGLATARATPGVAAPEKAESSVPAAIAPVLAPAPAALAPAEPPLLAAEVPPAPVAAPAQPVAAVEPPAAAGSAESPAELSRAERREGLAIADAAACAQYPNLTPGDKYYTETSRAVAAGIKKPGSRYKGDDKAKQLDLTSSGPRRARRPQ